jgi:hypothetical protein
MLTTYPTATPIDEQTIKAIAGFKPKLALIGDATTTPRHPPARLANKRLCTIFLLSEPSVLLTRKALGLQLQAIPEIT